MSKFKNGDKVIVKESGKVGIVKGREINTLPDGKVNVEYVVKLDDGFWNWKSYQRNELTKVVTEKPKKKANVKIFDAPMGSTYFYGKIVSMFGNSFKKGNGLGNIMKMMMFSQMMGGSNSGNNGFGQMMAMSMFMGGKENPFEGMFDFNMDENNDNKENDTED